MMSQKDVQALEDRANHLQVLFSFIFFLMLWLLAYNGVLTFL